MDAEGGLTLRQYTHCPACGGAIRARYRHVRDRFGMVDRELGVDECLACALRFTNPHPEGNLDALYPRAFLSAVTEPGQSDSGTAALERWYRDGQYRHDFRLFTRSSGLRLRDVASYLDIGCGTGDRLAFVRAAGCPQVLGIDAHDYFTAPLAKELCFRRTAITDFTPSSPFHMVSLFHVLEHVPDFTSLLRHIVATMVRPGGFLLLQVPNYESVERRIFASRWFALDAPRHLWHFAPEVLVRTMRDLRVDVVGVHARNAALHPVSIAPSFCRELDIQRIWVRASSRRAATTAALTLAWIGSTLATVPLSIAQNLVGRGSMLTIVARKP